MFFFIKTALNKGYKHKCICMIYLLPGVASCFISLNADIYDSWGYDVCSCPDPFKKDKQSTKKNY